MPGRYVQASARRQHLSKALVFGGAFNPPTVAHVDLAEFAMKAAGFDYVIFVPTKNTYISDTQHKEYVFSDASRVRMLEKIAETRPWMIVSRFELDARQQPRTYETLCHFRDQGYTCSLLFGSDKLPELEHGWKYVDSICREFGIVCMSRKDDDTEAMLDRDPYLRSLRKYILLLDTPPQTRNVSSTAVRMHLAEMKERFRQVKQILPEELHTMILDYMCESEGEE